MQLISTPSRAPRRHNVPLFIRLGDIPMGRTRNLSVTGLFVETNERPAVGSRHDLCIAWDDGTFHCTARIVRHAEDGVGLAFEEPDTFFEQAIRDIITDTEPARTAALPVLQRHGED